MEAARIAPHHRPDGVANAGRDWLSLLFVLNSLLVGLFVRQDNYEEVSTTVYLQLLVPAVLIAIARPLGLVRAMSGPAMMIVAFILIVAGWHALRGDWAVVPQVGFLGLMYIFMSSEYVRFRLDDLARIFIVCAVSGLIIWLTTDINNWGVIPGFTSTEFGVWRVSIFPNIAYTGFLSLILFMVYIKFYRFGNITNLIYILILYFLVLSFVRTAIIGAVVFIISYIILRNAKQKFQFFFIPIIITIFTNVVIGYSAYIFADFQSIDLISRLFLRGETELTADQIYEQLYRPWLWGQHWQQFVSSPYLMGWGSTPFDQLVTEDLYLNGLKQGDSVSMLTRFLAQYGLAAFLFAAFLGVCLWKRAGEHDIWACAAFPTVILAMMQWGSIFHPADALGFLLTLMILKGSKAFVLGTTSSRNVPRRALFAYRPA